MDEPQVALFGHELVEGFEVFFAFQGFSEAFPSLDFEFQSHRV
jgi:hypothetical protein